MLAEFWKKKPNAGQNFIECRTTKICDWSFLVFEKFGDLSKEEIKQRLIPLRKIIYVFFMFFMLRNGRI